MGGGDDDEGDGDSPLATEIRRLRAKSPEVLDLLISFGADPNASCCAPLWNTTGGGGGSGGESGNGASALSSAVPLGGPASYRCGGGATPLALLLSLAQEGAPSLVSASSSSSSSSSSCAPAAAAATAASQSSSRSARGFWVPAAHLLVCERGARWDAAARDAKVLGGDRQTHQPCAAKIAQVFQITHRAVLTHAYNVSCTLNLSHLFSTTTSLILRPSLPPIPLPSLSPAQGRTQLAQLFSCPPPPPRDMALLLRLAASALKTPASEGGFDPNAPDNAGALSRALHISPCVFRFAPAEFSMRVCLVCLPCVFAFGNSAAVLPCVGLRGGASGIARTFTSLLWAYTTK